MFNRRTFIGGTAGALAGSILSRPANAAITEFQPLPSANDERTKMLIATAMDAAKSAGANYADARLTFTQEMMAKANPQIREGVHSRPYNRHEYLAFGVRASFNGYWGFASSNVWTKDEAARLGRVAVDSAKANFSAKVRDMDMAPNPRATSGSWTMPVKDDPFEMDPHEICDYIDGLSDFINYLPRESPSVYPGMIQEILVEVKVYRQRKAFGNMEGQFVTQQLYRTGAEVGWTVNRFTDGGSVATGALDLFNLIGAGCGFELIRTPQIREHCRQLYLELAEEALLPAIPVDVGRFNCLIHPAGVAPLVKKTIGVATEIDRVMGFEANTTGTSYIIDPEQELGSLKIGAAALNVTATRSAPGAIMCVKWDDEGVEPKDLELIKNGVITNLQTHREGTAWMKNYLQKSGRPIASNGSSYAIDAHDSQAIHPCDLILHANPSQDTTITQLREQMVEGLEFKTAFAMMDFQQSTGMLANSIAFQIKKGKRTARILGPGVLFRTSELWGNLLALGGASSSRQVGTGDYKSYESKMSFSTVDAPAALFKELSVINPAHKA